VVKYKKWQELGPRIDSDDINIFSRLNTVQQQLEQTKKEVLKFTSHVESVEKMVLEAGEAIKRLVDSQVGECLLKLQSVKSESAKQAEIIEEPLQLTLVAMESFHRYSHELLDKGRPSDITRAAGELHKRATELLDNDVTSVQYCPPHVTFTPADVTQLTPLQLIGKLNVMDSGEIPGKYRVLMGSILCCMPQHFINQNLCFALNNLNLLSFLFSYLLRSICGSLGLLRDNAVLCSNVNKPYEILMVAVV